MLPSARLGDQHSCPLPGHGITSIATASGDVVINFMGAARVGDVCGCGAVITTGFPSIKINGFPMAHLGSPTSHGGTIITGSPDTVGGFTFGGAAVGTIINFAKLGAIRPDGSVNESLMAELLADPQLEERGDYPAHLSKEKIRKSKHMRNLIRKNLAFTLCLKVRQSIS